MSHLIPLRKKACEGEKSLDGPAWKKGMKVRSHPMPLRAKACEGEESPDTPRGKAREGEESPDAPVRILSAFQISLEYYASCLRPYKLVFN